MSTETEEKQEVKKGRKPNPPTKSIGSAFLLLRVYVNDHESLEEDESIEDRSLKTAKQRVIELYTENKDWARIEAIALRLDGQEKVLFTMSYLDAFPFFIEVVNGVTFEKSKHHYSKREDAQKAHAEFDKLPGGVALSNAFDRKVRSN